MKKKNNSIQSMVGMNLSIPNDLVNNKAAAFCSLLKKLQRGFALLITLSLSAITAIAQIPAVPTSVTATTASSTQINLTWVDASTNETGFQIERSTTSGTGFALIFTTAANAVSYSDAGVVANTTYYYRIRSTNGSGSSAYSTQTGSSTFTPSAPTSLTATAATTTSINLAWVDGSTTETGFQIWMSTTSGSGYSLLATNPANQVTRSVTGLSVNVRYYFQIRAINGALTSAYSNEATAITSNPALPTSVTAIATSPTQVTLSWVDNATNETGYGVERSTTSGTGFVLVTTAAINATGFVDTGLTTGTTYFYRIRALNGGLASAYTTQISTALVVPAVPTTLAGVGASTTQVNLTWVDASTNETGFIIERSTTSGSGFVLVTTTAANTTSYSNTGLTANTTYYYRIRSTNGVGSSANTAEVMVATSVPSTPTNFVASLTNSSGQITLTWTDASNNETGFEIERSSSSPSSGFSLVFTNAANTVSRLNTGLTVNTWYHYRIRSINAVGASSYSPVASVYVGIPAAPTSATHTIISPTQVNFTWADPNSFESGFVIDRSTTSPTTGFVVVGNLPPNTVSFSDVGLTTGTVYYYRIRAVNGAINSNSAALTVNLTVPAIPTSFVGFASGPTQISLFWTDNSTNETGFEVERSATSGSGFTLVATTAANAITYINTGLTSNASYYFRIRSTNAVGKSIYSPEVYITISAAAAATGLTATGISTTQIDLSWTDNSNNESGFQIERSTSATTGFVNIGSAPINATTFANTTGLTAGVLYYYRVRSVNGVGNFGYTPVVSAATNLIAPTGLVATAFSTNQINLTWTDASSNETGYQIERSLTAGSGFVLVATTAPQATSYSDTGLQDGTTYYYRVRAINAVSNSLYASEATASTPLAAPTALTATVLSSSQIKLKWSDVSIVETGYQVERSMTSGSGFELVNTTSANATEFIDQSLATGTVYYYRVRAINQLNIYSAFSTEVSTQTLTTEQELLYDLAFQYKYDARRRMSHKKVPGADWVYMVYDKRDRLVMTQDGNQRSLNQWTFTKYDALNRPVLTGIYTHGSTVDQATMQGVVNNYYESFGTNNGSWYETFSSNGAVHGYDNKSYPPVSDVNQYLTVTYYDDYGFKALYSNDPTNDYRPNQVEEKTTPTGTYNQGDWNQLVKGQLTGTKTKILGSTTFLLSVVYYDDKYRTIQTISDNHKGGKDCHTTMYDFAGNVLATNTMHSIPTQAERKVLRTFDYDHAGRLLKTWQKVGSESTILISKNEYNEIGELVTKNLHSVNQGASFKQQVDYRYTIRGWLSRINNSDLNNMDGGPKDFFGMNLHYENLQADIANTPLFDGAPSAIQWSQNQGLGIPSIGHLTEQAYTLEYDGMGRLANAFNKSKAATWQSGSNNEEKIRYDLNGNLNSILRKSNLGNLDHLQYKYGRGNQLKSVFDYGFAGLGFYDGNKTDDDFTYDLVGNLKKDLNKGISSFQYNELNLISQIDNSNGATIKSVYSADGIKLKEEVYQAGSNTASSTIDFAGQFVYVNGALEHLAFEEGKVVLNAGQPEYQYYIKDHLDNIRVTFTTKVDKTIVTATYEDSNSQGEAADFNPSYDKANRISTTLFNRTIGGAKSQRLSAAGSNDIVGLAKSMYVLPGDTIKLSVYAKYYTPSTNNTDVAGQIAAAITSSFGLSALSTGEAAKAYQSLNSIYAPGPFIGSDEWENATAPKAFLNYILFDKNYVPYDFGFDQISTNALETGSNVPHEKLELTALARVPGYVYVFLSNENDKIVDVFFDDLTITQVHSPVIQSDDYYPFGLSIKETSYQRGNSTYEGLVTAQGIGLKDIGFRQYDPVLGRFHGIDPLAELEVGLSPYQFAGNSPIENVDLLGLNIFDKVKELVKKVTYKIRLKINPRSTVYNPRRSGPGRTPSSSSNRPKPTGGNKPAPAAKTYTKPDKQEKRFIDLASLDDESEDDKDDLLKRLMWGSDEGNRDGVLGTARSGNGYAPIRQKPRTPGTDGEAMPKKEDHSPLLLPQSYEVARTSTDLNKLRSYLYTRHSPNEARAILAMAMISKQSKQVFSPLAANLFSVSSANAIFYDEIEKINPPPFAVFLRTGIVVNIKGYVSILNSFIITPEVGSDNIGLVVTKVEVGEHSPARTEHQIIFEKLAKKLKEYIGNRVFANQKAIDDFIQDQADELVTYKDQLLQNINDNDGVTDFTDRPADDPTTASLAEAANRYKTQYNVDSEVIILDKDRANQLAQEYANGRQPDKDIIVIIGRNEGEPLTKYVVYKEGFFNYSTERQETKPDGTVVTVQYTGTKAQIDEKRDEAIENAINNADLPVRTNELNEDVKINPDTQPELNMFEKILLVGKITKELLDDLQVKREYWDSQQKDQNPLPIQFPDFLAGGANTLINEAKSIPDMIGFALSLTKKEVRNEIATTISQLNWSDIADGLKGMFNEQSENYTSGNPEAQTYQASSDGAAVALAFLTGGEEILKKLKKMISDLLKLKEVDWDVINLPKPKAAKLGDDFANNEVLEAALIENPNLAKAWDAIDDELADAGEAIRKNPDALKSLDDAANEGLDGLNALEDAVQATGKPKPTWPEIQALFKRGNDFNRKAKTSGWYDYHEVHLSNGKRLDSYDPDLGEIVSRKATDFDNIQTSTFENYLKEINSKYAPGTVIRSNKYPDIDGQTLQGSKILEVPASNQTSSKLAEFTQLAQQYNVTIRFQVE